jgi:Domain of unknown function (DUF222)
LTALQAAMVAEVDRSGSYLDDCHRSTRSWVQAVSNSSKAVAINKVHMAGLLVALPVLAGAVAAGEIGGCQLRLLTRLHITPRCRDQLLDSEGLLVELARTLTLGDFRQACQRWEAHADPDGTHSDHQASRDNRTVRCSTVGSGHLLHAEGDALSGDVMTEILDAHARAELEDDLAELAARYGDQAGQHPLPRTAQQRRYDALLAIFLKAAGALDLAQPSRSPPPGTASPTPSYSPRFTSSGEPARSPGCGCETIGMMHSANLPRLVALCLDANDPLRLARFWLGRCQERG